VLVTVWWSGCWSRRPIRTERVRRVAHGWNIDSAVGSDAPDLSTPRLGVVGTGRGGAAGWCTLLGPEGPGFLPGVGRVVIGNGGGVDCFLVGVGPAGPSLGCMKLEGHLWGSVVPIVC
jgi:hypothetical protein